MINKTILVGHLGQDPEVRYTPAGEPICRFSLATSEKYSKDGETREHTEWHRLIAWGKLAEICGQYLKKGKQVYIEGKLQTRAWEKDGVKRYTTEINVRTMKMLGHKEPGESQESPDNYSGPPAPAASDDDFPF